MNAATIFLDSVFKNYYPVLKLAHEQRGEDKDVALYQRLLILGFFKEKENCDDLLCLIERWILERRSLIEYFCTDHTIDNCLESIIVSNNTCDTGINPLVVSVAQTRLEQVRFGMKDNLIED